MKRIKQIILVLSAMILAVLITVGCGSSQQATAPTPPSTSTTPTPAATQTSAEKATYVGTKTCAACHDDANPDKFPATSHGTEFKQLKDYKITNPEALSNVKVVDSLTTDKEVTATLDLNKDSLGVYLDDYIVVKTPQGFSEKGKFYRAAKLTKKGDAYEVGPASTVKDKPTQWAAADATSCMVCHAPGLAANAKDPGFSCETCHGPGSTHVSAPEDKKASTIKSGDQAEQACITCHTSNPTQNATTGVVTAQNHYGTRNYFASTHATSHYQIDCLTCHGPHKVNANGKLLRENNPNDICMKCHADKKYDVNTIMWKNTTDDHGHITADHSFGAMPYDQLGDKSDTKAIEITNQKFLDLIKKQLPDVIKK